MRASKSSKSGNGVYTIQEPAWDAELELHGMLHLEFGDLAQDSHAKFVAGGNPFFSPGIQHDRDTLLVGGKINLSTNDENDQLSLITSYDAELRSKYFGQTVSLMARYDFDQGPRYLKTAAIRNAALKARKVPDQLVTATSKDIEDIQQAIQPASNANSDPEARALLAVDAAIKTWISALSNKNLEVYFNSYAANFMTPYGASR